MATVQEKLARLHNRATLYELVISKGGNGGETLLVAYCGRYSFAGMLAAIRKRGERIVVLTGATTMDVVDKKNLGKFARVRCGEWEVRFTGRTERQAITEGEHQFIMD